MLLSPYLAFLGWSITIAFPLGLATVFMSCLQQQVSSVACRRGAVLSAAVFGALHNSGGRNWTFAAWAGTVGLLYGVAFISTKDLLVPIGAHCLANYASAAVWLKTTSARDAKPD